jgi:CBS domain-containing protein
MEATLAEISRFLNQHPPFDLLPAAIQDALARAIEVREVAADQSLLQPRVPVRHLYIVRSGRIELRGRGGEVWAIRTEGETFGVRALLSDGRAGFEATAIEAATLYLLPDREFARLRAEHHEFERFFTPLGGGNRRLAPADDRLSAETQPNLIALRVRDLMTPDPITVDAEASIREAAQLMRDRQVSSLPVTAGDRLAGILTSIDLRDRVVAEGVPPETKVASLMSRSPLTVEAGSVAFEALRLMRERGLRHLPVLDDDRLVGIVSVTDVVRRRIRYPGYLSETILSRSAPAALARIVAQVPQLLTMLVEAGETAHAIGIIITSIADIATYRLLQLAEDRLGPPPVPYVWLASGSQARQEQAGLSDQDNCLIIDDAFDPSAHGAYFADLSRFVCDGLAACGYAYCPGDMMATQPKWCQPLARWIQYFQAWIDEPDPKSRMLASVMFDLRPIRGDTRLFDALQAFTLGAAKASSLFVAHMAENALTHVPPLGLLGRFVLIRGGAHHHRLDLKLQGTVPIIDLARLYALQAGVGAANTRDRLVLARRAGVLSAPGMHDLIDALEFLSLVRLKHQSAQIRRGDAPDNFLSPDDLSRIERQHLRDAFVIVRTMQSALASGHQVRR